MNRLLSVEAIYDGGKIKNVSLEEVSVSGSSDVGGLVGYNRGGEQSQILIMTQTLLIVQTDTENSPGGYIWFPSFFTSKLFKYQFRHFNHHIGSAYINNFDKTKMRGSKKVCFEIMIWNLFVIWCLGFGIFFLMSKPEMIFVSISLIATIDGMDNY